MIKKQIIFLVEGKTEKAILEALQYRGKAIILNLWDTEFKKHQRKLPTSSLLIIIFDTDKLGNLSRFVENIRMIEKNRYQYILLQQTKNLEDELVYACHKLNCKKDLIKELGASGVDDCKSRMIELKPLSLKRKLESLEINEEKLWSRPVCKSIEHKKNTTIASAADLKKS